MINKKLLSSLTVGTLMLTTACSSDNLWDYDGSQSSQDEMVDVTFSISSETASLLTRADKEDEEGGPGRWQTLGKGAEIDMLIYAVYDADYTLLSQYSEGVKDPDNKLPEGSFTVSPTSHFGQTILYVGDKFQNGGKVEVTLRLMRKKTYHIAFWAQSSKTKAYDTNDLHHVEVLYTGAVNNDETRDVFCKSETFTVTDGGITQTVILTRPVAQINVGTSGADYKNAEMGKNVINHKAITYSKIKIEGVARYLDVVNNKVLNQDDIDKAIADTSDDNIYKGISGKATTNVEFNWAKIPAYYKVESIPTEDLYNPVAGEELLQIDLDHDGNILDYKTNYPTLGSKGGYMTEKFKYLSMAYVLVANPMKIDNNDGITNSKVIDNVTVWFAEKSDGTDGFQSLEVKEVPARTNWRTNILGGLKWMKDPTDPDDDTDDPDNPDPDPNDPPTPPGDGPDDTTIFNSTFVKPIIDFGFLGDKDPNIKDDVDNGK